MSAAYRTDSYSGLLTQTASLIGIDVADLGTTELTMLNAFFNKGLRRAWESQSWIDICPFGEVRFPTNLITYPNDYTQSAYWSANFTTVTAAALGNPLDNRTTACSVLENSATEQHSIVQNVTFIPNQPYNLSGYARPNGRNWLYVTVNDGASSYTGFFNLSQPSPVVGTVTGSGATGNLQLQANGFYEWILTIGNTSVSANTGSITVGFSTDGSTTHYAGNSSSGMYLWGTTAYLMQNILPASYNVPFSQLGEQTIESTGVFDVWSTDPGGGFIPGRVNYNLNPNGIELIGPSSIGPVYLYYRPQRPGLPSSSWSSSATYSVNQTFLYTSTAAGTSGIQNGYTVTTATSAGQNPDNTAASFSVIPIPYIFSSYIEWFAYGDWLIAEGQAAKAMAAYQLAQSFMDDENDKQERQAGWLMPWRVNTHVTSQNRGLGFQGQNFSPSGAFFIN